MEERAWFDFSLKIDGSWSSSVSMIDTMTHCVHINIRNYYDLLAYSATMLHGTFWLFRIISCGSH
jgi:hypothetical protein